jgi:lipoic acid synthetase
LIPDFKGLISPVEAAALSGADVIGHNIETVKRLYPVVRKEADYDRSLGVLASIKRSAPDILTKSAILAGLGETVREMLDTMLDLRKAGCDILSIGQYLSPSKEHHPVDRFVPPGEFEGYKEAGLEMGFKAVSAGPFVRSSYRAKETYDECCSAAVS